MENLEKLKDKVFVNYHLIANLESINKKLDKLIKIIDDKKKEREGIFR